MVLGLVKMDNRDYRELVERYDRLKRSDLQDLSADQDLVLAVMNLISIEEHLVFTGAKTENVVYYRLIPEIRKLRKQLLRRVMTDCEGETWCIGKHLLAASYRLLEVGSKQIDMANEQLAISYYQQTYHLYNLFWGLVMKLISSGNDSASDDQLRDLHVGVDIRQDQVSASDPEAVASGSTESENLTLADDQSLANGGVRAAGRLAPKESWQRKLRNMVQKLVNCCIE